MAYSTGADVKEILYRTLYYFEQYYGYSIMSDDKNFTASVSGPHSAVIDGLVAKAGILFADAQAMADGYSAWKQASIYQQGQASPLVSNTNNFPPKILNNYFPGI